MRDMASDHGTDPKTDPTHRDGLEITGVSRVFGTRQVLSDITLSMAKGQITCLLGQSGCGKSTLLRLIAGVDQPSSGQIWLGGRALVGPDHFIEPDQRNIGFMFQDYALFPHLSVAENLGFGLRHLSRAARQARIADIGARIGISHLITRYPHDLSGGEQQRVALARALAPAPQMLLMDEPFSNLDQGLREQVRQQTLQLLRDLGTTAIMVTHDPQEALAMGDQIILMRDGRIAQAGSPVSIYDEPSTPYVAAFMGTCNELPGIWRAGHLETPIGHFPAALTLPEGSLALACIRPQALTLGPDGIPARILAKTFLGESEQIDIQVHPLAAPLRMHSHFRIREPIGAQVYLRLNGAQVHVFAPQA